MPLHVLSPEARLLYRTARLDTTPADVRPLARRAISWPTLIWLAERERATPVLWSHLRDIDELRITDGERESVQNLAMVSEFKMHHLQNQLRAVVRTLDSDGIPCLLLKGAAMATTEYASFAERPMIDLDVLVPENRAQDAWNLLRRAGWSWVAHEELDQIYTGDHHHLSPLYDPAGTGTMIELHTALFPGGEPFDLPPDRVWAEARTLSLDGIDVRVPSRRHQIIHTSAHFAWSHTMTSASWRTVRDLARLVTDDLDWDDLVAEARRARAASCVYWSLRLARSLVGAEVPPHALEALRPPGSRWLHAALERAYVACLSPIARTMCPSVGTFEALWKLGIRPEWSGHGPTDPWRISEEFGQALGNRTPSVLERTRQATRALPRWFSFARAVLTPGG